MHTQYRLFPSLKVNPIAPISIRLPRTAIPFLPLYLPIHPRAKSLIVVGAEAHIEYRRSVLVLLDQPAACILILCVIQVYILVP